MADKKVQDESRVSRKGKMFKDKAEKKPFNKRLAMKKKFSNKYKIEKYQEQRKKQMLRRYKNELKEVKPGLDVSKIYAEAGEDETGGDPILQKKDSKVKFTRGLQQTSKAEEKAQEEFEQKKAKKEHARKVALHIRKENFRKLNKRTKTGQPSMEGRMEVIYKKIVAMTS